MNLPCRGWYFDRFRQWHLFYLALGIILVLLGYSSMALAGGIEIDPRRIAFDQDPEKREFPPNRVINFTFHYRAWAYAGKPNQYIVFELRNRERSSPARFFITYIDREEGFITARFSLPDPDTTYNLTYHVVTFFSHKPMIGSMFGGFVTLKEEEAIKKFYKTNYSGTQEIAEVRSLSGGLTTQPNDIMTIYFKPGLKKKLDTTIAAGGAPVFEWHKGEDSAPNVQDEEYSFRLDPLEEWSDYSTTTKATYYLITPGNYTFQVRARYKIHGQVKETATAGLPIQVRKVISVPPPLEILHKGSTISEKFWEENRYNRSKALLIAISQYNDNTFTPLPYVEKDVKLMDRTLRNLGFEVEIIDKETTKKKIEEGLTGLLDKSMRDDRVIIYFSGHGTSQGALNFLVTTDSDFNMKKDTCISYDWLKTWIERMMLDKGVKHLLVILDACQAGLGLYSKAATPTPLEVLAKYPGAHMMTAGLMEQNAHIDTRTGMSVFTQELINGLKGKADFPPQDKLITLSELLVYVQNEVPKYVSKNFNESQVPVMGKIKGAVEMLFHLQ